MEEVLNEIISNNGLKSVLKLTKDMDLEDCIPLMKACEAASYWKIDGHDM